MKRSAFIASLALALFSVPVEAAVADSTSAPLFSMRRVSLATGVDHRWGPAQEYLVGAYGAYNLTPKLSLVGSARYGFKSERVEPQVGIRLRIWQGK